ncbi:MAG: SOS response-associated peptidase [Chloroflexota bacterium]|nr:SOS response-associated peptidase [Chloroflexota bacterium]
MCGRFTLTASPDELQQAFPWLTLPQADDAIPPRYNIAPSQPIAVVPNTDENKLDYFLWGLIPFWAKDPKIGPRLINARGETLTEKPSFKAAFKYRRCLILTDGFYEWQHKTRTPYYIRMKSGKPFAFAGIWERWQSPDGSEILSSAIITTQPNKLLAPIHKRMPVILRSSDYTQWLTPGETSPNELDRLLVPFPVPEEMQAYPVSTQVNNPRNDNAGCVQPAPQYRQETFLDK